MMDNMPDFTIDKVKKPKRKNVGKNFEKDWKDSIPGSVFYYRFKDGTSSWASNDKLSFSTSNIADCMLYYNGKLYILELKTVQGKSFGFANVRNNQLIEMEKASKFMGIVAGFVINFRDIDKTVFIEINEFIDIMNRSGKKSFNQKDLEFHNYTEIEGKKKKVHFGYNVEKFLLTL